MSVFAVVVSGITLLTEFTTILFQLTGKSFSVFSWSFHLGFSTMFRIFFGLVLLMCELAGRVTPSYISFCFFYAFFNLNVPFIRSYSLYPHYTDVYALAENATYLTRFQFSLFFHFFTLLQVLLAVLSHALAAQVGL